MKKIKNSLFCEKHYVINDFFEKKGFRKTVFFRKIIQLIILHIKTSN